MNDRIYSILKTKNENEYAFGIKGGIYFGFIQVKKFVLNSNESYPFWNQWITSIVEFGNKIYACNKDDSSIIVIDRSKK